MIRHTAYCRRASTRFASNRGYALLMCLVVVAVSSSIVLTLFHVLRLQTSEAHARRQIVVSNSLADAAFEHALALLIDQPTLTGVLSKQVPGDASRSYTLSINQVSGDAQVTVRLAVGSYVSTVQRTLTAAQIDARRVAVGAR